MGGAISRVPSLRGRCQCAGLILGEVEGQEFSGISLHSWNFCAPQQGREQRGQMGRVCASSGAGGGAASSLQHRGN